MKEITYDDVAARLTELDGKPFDHSLDGLILRFGILVELAATVKDEIERTTTYTTGVQCQN